MATYSEIYVNKETEPPGPAQAAFNGLIPGRAYNISVQTVSENKISQPTIAQYRTVPWRPHNVTFDPAKIGPNQFEVSWSGPRELTEFDRYQVAIGIRRKTPQNIERNAPLSATFNENLRPGRTYQVVVKTVSGSVASWPATGNVTTQPLPVIDNIQRLTADNGDVSIMWEPNPDSEQDNYKVRTTITLTSIKFCCLQIQSQYTVITFIFSTQIIIETQLWFLFYSQKYHFLQKKRHNTIPRISFKRI